MSPKSDARTDPAKNLPHKVVAEELAYLRKNFRDLAESFTAQVEAEISALQSAVKSIAASRKKLPARRTRDLRDMLELLRENEIKPTKGRRRDLKKVEKIVGELRRITDGWADGR
jgi:HAMP domain-containing protein